MNGLISNLPEPAGMPIASVERETGISKELLRQWERRYQFPNPMRNAAGDRLYSVSDVARLKMIRRLLDQGYRPSKLVTLDELQLQALLNSHQSCHQSSKSPHSTDLDVVQGHDAVAVREFLHRRLFDFGLRRFVCEFLPEANHLIGQAWQRGDLQVYEEHLYSEALVRVMREAMATLSFTRQRPCIMLTTCTGELHTLGLLMVETMLRLQGCETIAFGPQMPLSDIISAAQGHAVDVVVLSFSAAYTGHVTRDLQVLSDSLPSNIEVWFGGAGVPYQRQWPTRCHLIGALQDLEPIVAQWRAQNQT